jgi:azurin
MMRELTRTARSVLVALSCCELLALAPSSGQTPAATPKPKAGQAVRLAMRDGLRFDPPRFAAASGELLEIEIENADATQQQHNFLLIAPGKREEAVSQALALGEQGPAREFIPENPGIIVHSALLQPEKLQTITFAAPKEKGVYPYVCTFPGHGVIMYGALYVDTPMSALDKDPNIPPIAATGFVVGRGQRPFIQRMFMPQCGPSSDCGRADGRPEFLLGCRPMPPPLRLARRLHRCD